MASKAHLSINPMWGDPLTKQTVVDDFMAVFLNFSEQVPMTIRERRELRKWIKFTGNPFWNPWNIFDDNGCDMNFIDAYRIIIAENIDDCLGHNSYDTEEVLPF